MPVTPFAVARHARASRIAVAVLFTSFVAAEAVAQPQRLPRPGYSFAVEIEGIQAGRFREVTGLGIETEVIEFRDGGSNEVRKLPGRTKYPNITLKRGFTGNSALFDWAMTHLRTGSVTRTTIFVSMHDAGGAEIARWKLEGAWPVRWEGPSLKSGGTEVAMETLEIAHEGLTMSTGDERRRHP